MFQSTISYQQPGLVDLQAGQQASHDRKEVSRLDSNLAASITKEASSQTFLTIRYLADSPLAADAYRAYAYFRWVDDVLDQEQTAEAERMAFLARQQAIIKRCYLGEWPGGLRPEEQLVVDLIRHDGDENSGLRIYIEQMMAVMAFDAGRRDRLISEEELTAYTRSLAMAVTEALHYFIGHGDGAPLDETRYDAVMGAHVTHMLRDAIEDAAVGYINVPGDYLEAHSLSPTDFEHDAYRAWVRSQVQLARRYFASGRRYMAQVENFRCRLAGYAYIARFEVVLDLIEREDYLLRPAYPERKSKKAALKMAIASLGQAIGTSLFRRNSSASDYQPQTETM
jgi:phytoene/squalene synthetase